MSLGFEGFLDDCSLTFGTLTKQEFREQSSDGETVRVTVNGESEEYHAVGYREVSDTGAVNLVCFDWAMLDEEALEQIAEEEDIDLNHPQAQAELEELRGELILMLRRIVPFHQVEDVAFTEEINMIFS